MFLLDGTTVVYSASDLVRAEACEFAVLRDLDVKLGLIEPPELVADAMLERVAQLGMEHEARVLADYVQRYGEWDPAGRGVVRIPPLARGKYTDRVALEAKHAETVDALRTGADVVFQASFFDGRFVGRADFLVRVRDGGDLPVLAVGQVGAPVWAVYDTKLAKHAKPSALLQVAAYADQLETAGITPAEHVHLILGDGTTSSHLLANLLPGYRRSRAHLQEILDEHQHAGGPVTWGDARYLACLRCEWCAPEVEARRDVLLVAGLRASQRVRLHEVGITTMDQFAESTELVDGIGVATLERLRAQARLQVKQNPVDGAHDDGVEFDLFAPEVIGDLPAISVGDIFFDFEGDPLWAEMDGAPDNTADGGLEYLFGVVEAPLEPGTAPVFRPFWAHDRTQEKQALVDFLDYVAERRAQFADMHVYHYAAYEKSALLRLARRHGVAETEVNGLLDEGVLVDLYATVRASLRTGQRSYSLKKLEPLYMDVGRGGEVTNASESMVEYSDACAVRDLGDLEQWESRLARIAEYNQYDCVSTLRLRDWLLARAAEASEEPDGIDARDPETDLGVAATTEWERAADAAEATDEDGLTDAVLILVNEGLGEA